MNRSIYFLTATFLLCSLPSFADEPIDESRPLNTDAVVSVKNTAGVIQVQTWDKKMLSLTGRLGEGVEKLIIEGDAARLRIEVKLPRNAHNVEDTELLLRVPAGVSLDLDSVSADVDVQGTRGPVKVNSVSGKVRLIVGSPAVQAQSVSGDMRVEAPAQDTQLKSVSGDLFARGLQGEVVAETVSGSLHIEGAGFSRLKLKSVSGDLNVVASLTDSAHVDLETLSGEATLALPASTNATVNLTTFSGDVESELGRLGDNARKGTLRLGSGAAQVNLHSFSGDVRLQKR